MLENNAIWDMLAADSLKFEQSMEPLYRKQTGSYYTALELASAMMQELISSLSEEKRNKIYELKFLEPCVGTGNFVFAYLRACISLKLEKAQYQTLLDNIYVCDINQAALNLYKSNLIYLAREMFDIELRDSYFDTHIGTGLLFNVDAEDMKYIPIEEIFDASVIGEGFDFVVTNPPYKNLRAEKPHYAVKEQYERDKKKYREIGKIARNILPYSATGVLNFYKMFVEEITERYVAPDGVCSLLVPASILSDKTCAKLRTRILENSRVISLRMLAENSNYVAASQALCAILLVQGDITSNIYMEGSFDGKKSTETVVAASDFLDVDTENAILVLTKEEYKIRKQMLKAPMIKDISYINNLRGELDITTHMDAILTEVTPYKMYRGRNIGFYHVIYSTAQEYVRENFVETTAKKRFIKQRRLVCQQIANMAKERRISFAEVPENSVLGNSCNFIALEDNPDGVDLEFLLGVLNSKLINWYFKLTSSNNHINNYEIDNFPIPIYYSKKELISEKVKAYLNTWDTSLLDEIEELVCEAYNLSRNEEDSKHGN